MDKREQRTVDDADGAERDEQRGDATRLVRENAEAEAEDGVQAELAGEDHDGSGGGLFHGVGEPAVEGEDRRFDGEGDEESKRAEPKRGGVG